MSLNRIRRLTDVKGLPPKPYPHAKQLYGADGKPMRGVWQVEPNTIELKPMQHRKDAPKGKGVTIFALLNLNRCMYTIGPLSVTEKWIYSDESKMRTVLSNLAGHCREMFAKHHKMDVPFEFIRRALQVRESA